jgi:hypothetical protein
MEYGGYLMSKESEAEVIVERIRRLIPLTETLKGIDYDYGMKHAYKDIRDWCFTDEEIKRMEDARKYGEEES